MCKPRDGNGQVSGSVTKDTVNNGYIYLQDACMHIHEVHFYKILLLKQKGFDLFTTQINHHFQRYETNIININIYRRYVDIKVVSVNMDDLCYLK